MEDRMDMVFLEKFVPYSEMAVIRENLPDYERELERVEAQIRAMPAPHKIASLSPSQIRIGMHYFGGSTDIWIHALEKDGYAEAFVCLNGDAVNAECGPVFIPEFLGIPIINLDLHWDSNITLGR